MRTGKYSRETRETQITVKVVLDGVGETNISTGIRYFDHLITSLATHSMIDITIEAKGDLKHHVVEDVAICLGEAILNALGDGTGIQRFGYAWVPMDESLVFASIDLIKRPYFKFDLQLEGEAIEDTKREDIQHFLETLASFLRCNLHVGVLYGSNDHHKAEAAIKALALALRQAVTLDPRRSTVPSSKGTL